MFTAECSCGRDKTVVEFVRVSTTRTIIRCAQCHGMIGYSDSDPVPTKEYPIKKARKYNPDLLDKLK
jgi:hypothetical protein